MAVLPRGKEIRIYESGVPILSSPNYDIASGIRLRQEEDVLLNISSSFEEIFSGSGNTLVDAVGGAIRDFSGGRYGGSSQFKQFGFQIWKKSQPIVMNFTFTFYMGMANVFSGRTEVEEPIRRLASLPLPTENANGNLIPPGPSILQLLNGGNSEFTKGLTYSIIIGESYRFPNVIITRAEPTLGQDKDEQGYSTWGKIQLEVRTAFNGTVELLNTKRADFTKQVFGAS